MSGNTSTKVLTARRQLGFLATFDKKFEGFRREMERLRRASVTGKSFGGRWPTEGLERITKSLVGAGAVYSLAEITEWARAFLGRLDAIRTSAEPPTEADLGWLASQIGVLGTLYDSALVTACALTGDELPSPIKTSQVPPAAEVPPGARDSAPFIAPSRTTDPPPPMEPQRPRSDPPPKPVRPSTPPPHKPPTAERSHATGIKPLVYVAAARPEVRAEIAIALKRGGFDTREIPNAEELHRLAVEESPELVVIDLDDDAPAGKALMSSLAADPLTDFVPVVKIGTLSGPPRVDEIPKPIDTERFLAVARRVATPEIRAARVTIGLSDPSLAELLEFVNEELRAGVLDAATGDSSAHRIRIPSEGRLMAAVWGLIAQLRRAAAEGTRGMIRFLPATSGQLGMMALAEADDVLDATFVAEVADADIAALAGVRAVVADDDPEVRALFARVLSEAGVRVRLAIDGQEALEAVRREPPDFIVSDILMPAMDGWELCNRLRADYALRHIPVILLSWKEDFLERLRGLNVDANDFMLKEVDRKQIVARVVRVMRPRLVLERQLGIHGDVSGRIERLGVAPIIASVSKLRPNCRIAFRETWNYFETDIRDGELIAVTRTGTDGTFASGQAALERLLGVTSGRFAVVEPVDTPRRQFAEGAKGAIEAACRRLNGLVAQVTDGALIDIATVEIDPEVRQLYAQIMPPKLRVPLERLAEGVSPREIILAQEASPDALENLLLDLIRVGALTRINAPPPNLARAPITRDSVRWRALGDGRLIDEETQEVVAPPPTSERPSVEPIDTGDLEAIDQRPSRDAPLPPLSRHGMGRSSAGWKTLAVIALLALALSAFFNYRMWAELGGVPSAAPGPEPVAEPEPVQAPAAAARPEPVAQPEPAAQPEPVAQPAPQPSVAPSEPESQDTSHETGTTRRTHRTHDKAAPGEPDEPYSSAEPAKKPTEPAGADNPYDSEKPAPKAEHAPEPAADAAQPTATTGKLSVSPAQDVGGPVAIAIDGVSHGNAPLTIELPAGLHEVALTIDGKRTLRMVNIKGGQTKSVVAKGVP
jgi:CheY-like chemotaxis protein